MPATFVPASFCAQRRPGPPSTRLLVSVRDAQEAAEAAGAGAHIIDAKDPARGALGAVDPGTLTAILQACPAGMETSAALGDLADLEASPVDGGTHWPERRLESRADRVGALTYLKIGLGGAPEPRDAERRMELFITRLGAQVRRGRQPRLVVACYADHRRAAAPPPEEVPDLARRAGAGGCLLDTGIKDGSCLFDWIDDAALLEFVGACRRNNLLCALAGSLRAEHLPRLTVLRPDLIGVRSAACEGDRIRGRVRASRVAALTHALANAPTS